MLRMLECVFGVKKALQSKPCVCNKLYARSMEMPVICGPYFNAKISGQSDVGSYVISLPYT